jgi:fibronectin type 3 domain-containing protein
MRICSQRLGAAGLALLVIIGGACGRKTLPMVPDSPRPETVKGVRAEIRDIVAFLSWPVPTLNVEGKHMAPEDIQQFRISRAEFSHDRKRARYKPYAEIDMTNPSPAKIHDGMVFWSDPHLQYGQVYGYRIRAVSVRGGASAWSDEVRVAPLLSLAIPKGLAAQGGDSHNLLSWEPVTTRMDGSRYEGFVGYNIYRSSEKGRSEKTPLNREPLRTNSYKDTAAENGRTYYYRIRAVDSPALPWRESLDSEEISAAPQDMTPPERPKGLTVVPGVNRVFLSWNENRERDHAGYHVYRSSRSGRDYERLTDKPLVRTTFSDETARTGTTYWYTVTAVDQSGNESVRSEEKKAYIEKLR